MCCLKLYKDGWSHVHFCVLISMQMHKVTCTCTQVVLISMQMDQIMCTTNWLIYAEGWTCILVELIIYPDNKIICKTYWLVYTDWWNHLHLYICSVNLCADGWSHLHNSLLRLFRLMNSSALVHIYYVCLYANGYALVHVHLHRDKQS